MPFVEFVDSVLLRSVFQMPERWLRPHLVGMADAVFAVVAMDTVTLLEEMIASPKAN